ncbi:MAG: thermonuclease family protein [SAR324 cluster bacterium]|nr:thermonuclease family protein [SAR324 cluster bacterium]
MKLALLYVILCLLWLSLGKTIFDNSPMAAEAIPYHWDQIPITYLNKKVIDGDTFYVDLNQNERFEKNGERIRLLYVDTPEISDSPKGKNLKFGLPAKQFLERILQSHHANLWINPHDRFDRYGRFLAVLEVRKHNINLELIQRGYSYFDTRFSFPSHYQIYTNIESNAFTNKRGIWGTNASRRNYLRRLKKEGKTVYSLKNELFIPQVLTAQTLKLKKYRNRFIMVQGKIIRKNLPHKNLELLFLQNLYSPKGVQVAFFKNRQKLLKLHHLKPGDDIYLEGFVSSYRNHLEIILHRGHLL